MNSLLWNNQNYILADNEFIIKLSTRSANLYSSIFYNIYMSEIGPSNKSLDKEGFLKKMKRSKLKFVISYCPFCNNIMLFCETDLSMEKLKEMVYCTICGDSEFMVKAIRARDDIDDFVELTSDKSLTEKSKRLLMNQLVVMISTQIECFVKDYYAASLNMKLIKFRQSSYSRFLRDCGNDFINPSKTNQRLKKELGITLKELIHIEDYNAFTKLSAYRNVIVHNNGRADKSFLSQNNMSYQLGDIILVTDDDVDNFRQLYKNLVVKLMGIYRREFIPRLLQDSDTYSSDIIYNAAYLNHGQPIYFRDVIKHVESSDA